MIDQQKNYKKDTEDWVPAALPIPEHWSYLPFDEAFDVVPIGNIKIQQKDYLDAGLYPVIDQGQSLIGGFTDAGDNVISEERALIVFGDHTKRFKYVNFRFAPGADGIKVLKPIAVVDEKFAYYACLSLKMPDRGYSRHYSFLRRSQFPIAPQREQLRIVVKIEELFSHLDKGIESLKTARKQLKIYRQAVLKHAFEGKLTEQWRKKNKDGPNTPEQLLVRIAEQRDAEYQRRFAAWKTAVKKGERNGSSETKPLKPRTPQQVSLVTVKECESLPPLPTGWAYLRLGTLIDEPAYGTSKRCDYEIDGIGVLRIPNVVQGKIDPSDLKFAHFEDNEIEPYRLQTGDLLTIRSNGSLSLVGRCALVSQEDERYLYAGYLIRLRPDRMLVNPSYLLALLSSHLLRSQIEGKAKSTSGVNNINAGEIQDLIIPYCSPSEQEHLIDRLAETLSSIDATELEIEKQLKRSVLLRQAILKKAFSGGLVAPDPNDEPASILLERIKAVSPSVNGTYNGKRTNIRKRTTVA